MKFSTQFLLITTTLLVLSTQSQAQVTRGFDRQIPATALNAEVVRQPSLQVMQVEIKPVRIIWVETPDPATGEVKKRQVWYLVWRAINRPVRKRQDTDIRAVNQLDPLPGPLQFIPEFTLITYDNPETEIPNQILSDQIIPNAVKEIEKIERVKAKTGIPLNNTVSAIQDFPQVVSPDAEQQPWIYGVATWSNVDPKTDFFKIILHGFSNGYENRGTIEQPDLWRKVVIQKFVRPGDEFDPNLKEFQFKDAPKWTYQPDRSNKPAAAVNN